MPKKEKDWGVSVSDNGTGIKREPSTKKLSRVSEIDEERSPGTNPGIFGSTLKTYDYYPSTKKTYVLEGSKTREVQAGKPPVGRQANPRGGSNGDK